MAAKQQPSEEFTTRSDSLYACICMSPCVSPCLPFLCQPPVYMLQSDMFTLSTLLTSAPLPISSSTTLMWPL